MPAFTTWTLRVGDGSSPGKSIGVDGQLAAGSSGRVAEADDGEFVGGRDAGEAAAEEAGEEECVEWNAGRWGQVTPMEHVVPFGRCRWCDSGQRTVNGGGKPVRAGQD